MERVSLENSEDVMLTDRWDVKEKIFLSILEEAYRKNLSDKTKIKVTRERFIRGTEDIMPIARYQTLYYNFSTLKSMYKEFYNREYTLENEVKRQKKISDFKEYLDRCRTGAVNGIYKIISDVQSGKYF